MSTDRLRDALREARDTLEDVAVELSTWEGDGAVDLMRVVEVASGKANAALLMSPKDKPVYHDACIDTAQGETPEARRKRVAECGFTILPARIRREDR